MWLNGNAQRLFEDMEWCIDQRMFWSMGSLVEWGFIQLEREVRDVIG